jgi:hypothetical protein
MGVSGSRGVDHDNGPAPPAFTMPYAFHRVRAGSGFGDDLCDRCGNRRIVGWGGNGRRRWPVHGNESWRVDGLVQLDGDVAAVGDPAGGERLLVVLTANRIRGSILSSGVRGAARRLPDSFVCWRAGSGQRRRKT